MSIVYVSCCSQSDHYGLGSIGVIPVLLCEQSSNSDTVLKLHTKVDQCIEDEQTADPGGGG